MTLTDMIEKLQELKEQAQIPEDKEEDWDVYIMVDGKHQEVFDICKDGVLVNGDEETGIVIS